MPISRHNLSQLKREATKFRAQVAQVTAIVDKDGMVKHCTPLDFDEDLIERHGVSYYTRNEKADIARLIKLEQQMYEDRINAPIDAIPALSEYVATK